MSDNSKDNTEESKLVTIPSTGVVLSREILSIDTLFDVIKTLEENRPMPPMIYVESLGREEPNEEDPEYKKKAADYSMLIQDRIMTSIYMEGCTVAEIPDSMFSWNSGRFLARLEMYGHGQAKYDPKHPRFDDYDDWRRVVWLKKVAAPDQNDTSYLLQKLGFGVLVSEEGVEGK